MSRSGIFRDKPISSFHRRLYFRAAQIFKKIKGPGGSREKIAASSDHKGNIAERVQAFGNDARQRSIQLTLSDIEVKGFWIANLTPGASVLTPRLAIGVHSDGDWHGAVDYYLSEHRPRWRFPNVPSWFRDQGAIYAVPGFGAEEFTWEIGLCTVSSIGRTSDS